MAEEELNVIEEEEAAGIEADETPEEEDKKPRFSKKQLIIYGGAGLGAVLTLLIVIMLFSGSDEVYDLNYVDEVDSSLKRKKPTPVSSIEKLIKKANLLYAQGHRKEALALFKQIAVQSEAISYYNLGVTHMKNEQYESALGAFKKAIEDNENITISAINAAVCSLHLNNHKNHNYYIALAKSSLDEQKNSPLFAYFKGLIDYYQNRPFETIATLSHPTSNYHDNEKNYLLAKSAYALGDSELSISYLEKVPSDEDLTALGMMYARIGNLDLAKKTIRKALESGLKPVENGLALAHISLKKGDIQEASMIYKEMYDKNHKNYLSTLPIKVFLEPNQFDLKAVQRRYKSERYFSQMRNLKILLHYAPFKIYDATQTIGIIKKGSANIFIEDINTASLYLNKGTKFSKVNQSIAKAIENALKGRLHQALEDLEAIVDVYPKHSILNYNIGLTYAKLGDLNKAHKYFKKSYHQDAKNYFAGIYAIMTGKIIGQEPLKLKEIFKENLDTEIDTKDILLVKALLAFYDKQYTVVANWEDDVNDASSMRDVLLLLTYRRIGDEQRIDYYAKQLVKSAAKDIVSHLLYLHSVIAREDDRDFATLAMQYLQSQHLSVKDIFYGSQIVEELFIEYTFVTGFLYDLRTKLKKEQGYAHDNIIPITKALARTYLYLTKFEEAYVLYNEIIDTYKQKDSTTLFQAALAATASEHHANAIALLELANLRNRYNMESRYALGLLYLEEKNFNAASIQFGKITQSGFQSKHFNFMIDTDNLGNTLPIITK